MDGFNAQKECIYGEQSLDISALIELVTRPGYVAAQQGVLLVGDQSLEWIIISVSGEMVGEEPATRLVHSRSEIHDVALLCHKDTAQGTQSPLLSVSLWHKGGSHSRKESIIRRQHATKTELECPF